MTTQAPPDLGKCQCCNDEPAVGAAAVPGMPITIVWGQRCLEAEIIPYSLLVANTAMIGGLADAAPWWRALVKRTLKYFGKTDEEFEADVARDMSA